MRAVNLLPFEHREGANSIRYEDPAVVVGSALGVIVMIAVSTAFLTAHAKASSQQKRLDAARLELAQLSERKRPAPTATEPAVPVTPILPPPAVSGQEATWLSAVSTTLAQRIAWDRLLREVSLVMPDDVTLTSLGLSAPVSATASPPGGAAPTTSQDFVIAGSAYSYDSVARLLSRLALVPDLSDVTLASTGAAGQGSSSAVQFNITAAVKGAPAPAAPATTTTAPVTPATTTTGVSS
jgi:hypothetical protein